MTLKYLLDTSIVSAPVSKAPDAQIVQKLARHEDECAISATVWHELIFGVNRLPEGKRRIVLESYMQDVVRASFPILPYDEIAATWHGRERARLDALGRPAPFADGQIAAVAHANGLILVTVNAKDFFRFKDVRVEDWSRRRARG